jgi:hypothetical protein
VQRLRPTVKEESAPIAHPLRGTAFGRKYRMVLAAALAMLALNEQPDSRELETAVSGRCAVAEDLPEQLGLSIGTLRTNVAMLAMRRP